MFKIKYLIFILLFLRVVDQSDAQTPKIKTIGLPFITYYGPSDYKWGNQNFDVLIGDDQKVYFANMQGILIYDGTSWTRLILPNEVGAYSLTKASDGTIYVGAVNEIGFLKPQQNGELTYVSLMSKLQKHVTQGFTSWNNFTANNQVIFSTLTQVFIYDIQSTEMSVLDCPAAWAGMMVSRDKVYSYQGDSLYILDNLQWKNLRPSNLLKSSADYRIVLVEVSESETIAINYKGFFHFESEQSIEIHPDVKSFLENSVLISAKLLYNQYIAISTWSGLMVTDLNGNPIKFLNKSRGLYEDFLYHMALDNFGGLWLASLNGVMRIDISSPYSFFDSKMNITGTITDTKLHGEYLYLSSFGGVSRLKWDELLNPLGTLEVQKMAITISHGLIQSKDDLIVLTEWQHNLALLEDKFEHIEGTFGQLFWVGFKYEDSDDLMLGSNDGVLIHLSKQRDKWTVLNTLDTKVLQPRSMVQEEGNDLWVGSTTEGIFRLTYDREKEETIQEKKYGKTQGLPSDLDNQIYRLNGENLFITTNGIYTYDFDTDRFNPDSRFENIIGEENIWALTGDDPGNLYYISDKFYVLTKQGDDYSKKTLPNIDLLKYPPQAITALDSQNILISSVNAIIHVDPSLNQPTPNFEISFTGVKSQNSDSIFYGGFGSIPKNLLFDANDGDIRISFSAACYEEPESTLYRWRLGNENPWSEWSNENRKDYTNLPHGGYTFEVMAKNVFGTKSNPAAISFIISTPWYFTFWAYFTYVLVLGLMIWLFVRLYTRKLIQDKNRLEKVVDERTEEINLQRNRLIQMDDLKRRFFVNISHELRTPLTLSMGTVDQALRGAYGQLNDELYANLQVSKRNNQRLMKMVSSILDISKLEGGKIQLYAEPSDPTKIIGKVLAFFSSRFADKKISLIEILIEGQELYIDHDKFETILINLISNAFKFTPDGGTISVSTEDQPDQMVITVLDSGDGIPEQDLALVFDRFYQSPTIKSGEGMGVGLALSKELVELHGGSIEAKNENGAVFTLTFLKGKGHLAPNQIMEPDQSQSLVSLEDKYPLHDDRKFSYEPTEVSSENLAHILLVEDNPEMSQFVSSILKPYYKISQVSDGAQGLDFLKTQKPDLIVTDYLMPNIDGYEMAVEIKKSDELAFIPIIFLTARAREQDKIDVLNLGVDDYLHKPFSSDELLIRIKNLLVTKKQRNDFLLDQSIDPRDIEWKEFPSKLKITIDQFVVENIKNDITGKDLAQATGQSERSLLRKVKVNTGLSLTQYVKEYKLRKARALLENKEMHTVSEVSYAVGFNYLSHFTKSYKERFGKQPSEYLD